MINRDAYFIHCGRNLSPGECLEVHMCDGLRSVMKTIKAVDFVKGWWYCFDDEQIEVDSSRKYLGIVHEDGAYLVELPR